MSDSPDSLIAYFRENSRVRLMPQRWSDLWELLPHRIRIDQGREPPIRLIVAARHDTPAMLKMLRPAEHIEWAVVGAVESVAAFLRGPRGDEWFHLGD